MLKSKATADRSEQFRRVEAKYCRDSQGVWLRFSKPE
jgi:hypothetical protein